MSFGDSITKFTMFKPHLRTQHTSFQRRARRPYCRSWRLYCRHRRLHFRSRRLYSRHRKLHCRHRRLYCRSRRLYCRPRKLYGSSHRQARLMSSETRSRGVLNVTSSKMGLATCSDACKVLCKSLLNLTLQGLQRFLMLDREWRLLCRH